MSRGGERVAELTHGRLRVDLLRSERAFRIRSGGGSVELTGTVVDVDAPAPDLAFVHVLEGHVKVEQALTESPDVTGRTALPVAISQEALVAFRAPDSILEALPQPIRARALTLARDREHASPSDPDLKNWTDPLDHPPAKSDAAVGQLIVKDEQGREAAPLTVARMDIEASVRGPESITKIDQSFLNTTDRTLEGTFYFPLPPGAAISRFAMYVDANTLIEGEVVERGKARAIFNSILRQRRDPALLEWMEGNLFKARIFPIPPRSEKRVILEYTQLLPAFYDTRRYVFPLVSELTEKSPIGKLSVRVNLATGDGSRFDEIYSPSYAKQTRVEGLGRANAVATLNLSNIKPTADFVLTFSSPRSNEMFATGYAEKDEQPYVLLGYEPRLTRGQGSRTAIRCTAESAPARGQETASGRDVLFLVETSGSRSTQDLDAQRRVLESMLSGLDPAGDRVALAAADIGITPLTQGFQPIEAADISNAMQSLKQRVPLGGLDLGKSLSDAVDLIGAEKVSRRRTIIFLGAGVPALGTLDAGLLAEEASGQLTRAKTTFTAVGIGRSVETLTLSELARRSGGFYVPLKVDEGLEESAFQLGLSLQSPLIESPVLKSAGDTLSDMYPAQLGSLLPGQEVFIHGRVTSPPLEKGGQGGSLRVSLSATLSGAPFSRTFDIKLPRHLDADPAVGRFWARARLDYLLASPQTDAQRKEVIDLAQTWTLMSPYTSFLVLESNEDYQRYDIDRSKRRPVWKDAPVEPAETEQPRIALGEKLSRVVKELGRELKSPETVELRIYDIADLTSAIPDFPGPELDVAFEARTPAPGSEDFTSGGFMVTSSSLNLVGNDVFADLSGILAPGPRIDLGTQTGNIIDPFSLDSAIQDAQKFLTRIQDGRPRNYSIHRAYSPRHDDEKSNKMSVLGKMDFATPEPLWFMAAKGSPGEPQDDVFTNVHYDLSLSPNTSKTVDGKLILIGTKDNPVEISNQAFVQGDIIIKGYYTGVGTMWSQGNIDLPTDLQFKSPELPINNENLGGMIAGGTIVIGDYLTASVDAPPAPPDFRQYAREQESSSRGKLLVDGAVMAPDLGLLVTGLADTFAKAELPVAEPVKKIAINLGSSQGMRKGMLFDLYSGAHLKKLAPFDLIVTDGRHKANGPGSEKNDTAGVAANWRHGLHVMSSHFTEYFDARERPADPSLRGSGGNDERAKIVESVPANRAPSDGTYIWQYYLREPRKLTPERLTAMSRRLADPGTSEDERALLRLELARHENVEKAVATDTKIPAEETAEQKAGRLLREAERLGTTTPPNPSQAEAAEAAYQSGMKLYNDLDYDEAKKNFERAVAADPANEQARQKLQIVNSLLGIHVDKIARKIKELESGERVKQQESLVQLSNALQEGRLLEERGTAAAPKPNSVEDDRLLADQLEALRHAQDKYKRVKEILNWMPPTFDLPAERTTVDEGLTRLRQKIADKEDEINFLRRKQAQEQADSARVRETDLFQSRIKKLSDQTKDLFDRGEFKAAECLSIQILKIDPFNDDAEGMKKKARGAYHAEAGIDVDEAMISYAPLILYPGKWDQISRRAEKSALPRDSKTLVEEYRNADQVAQPHAQYGLPNPDYVLDYTRTHVPDTGITKDDAWRITRVGRKYQEIVADSIMDYQANQWWPNPVVKFTESNVPLDAVTVTKAAAPVTAAPVVLKNHKETMNFEKSRLGDQSTVTKDLTEREREIEEVRVQANAHSEAAKRLLNSFQYEDARKEFELAVQTDRTNEENRKWLIRTNDILGVRRDRIKSAVAQLYGEHRVAVQEKLIELDNRVDWAKRYLTQAQTDPDLPLSERIRKYQQGQQTLERARELIKYMPVEVKVEEQNNEINRLLTETGKSIAGAEARLQETDREEAARLAGEYAASKRSYFEKKVNKMVDEAASLFEVGQFDEAVTLSKKILELDPTNPEAHSVIATARERAHIEKRKFIDEEYKEQFELNREHADRLNMPHRDYLIYPDNWQEITKRTAMDAQTAEIDALKKEIEEIRTRYSATSAPTKPSVDRALDNRYGPNAAISEKEQPSSGRINPGINYYIKGHDSKIQAAGDSDAELLAKRQKNFNSGEYDTTRYRAEDRKELAIAMKDDTIRRQGDLIAQAKADNDRLNEANKLLAEQKAKQDQITTAFPFDVSKGLSESMLGKLAVDLNDMDSEDEKSLQSILRPRLDNNFPGSATGNGESESFKRELERVRLGPAYESVTTEGKAEIRGQRDSIKWANGISIGPEPPPSPEVFHESESFKRDLERVRQDFAKPFTPIGEEEESEKTVVDPLLPTTDIYDLPRHVISDFPGPELSPAEIGKEAKKGKADPAGKAKPKAASLSPIEWELVVQRAELAVLGKKQVDQKSKAEILKKLQDKISFDLTDCPFDEAINTIRRKTKATIIVDPKIAAKDVPNVTLRVADMEADLALKWVANLSHLEFVLRDNAVYLTQVVPADAVELRIYDVSDINVRGYARDSGGFSVMNALCDLIRTNIFPESWDPRTGTSIEEMAGRLVVMQQPQVHDIIERTLQEARNDLVRKNQTGGDELSPKDEAQIRAAATAERIRKILAEAPNTSETAGMRLLLIQKLAALSSGIDAYRALANGIADFKSEGPQAETLARDMVQRIRAEHDAKVLDEILSPPKRDDKLSPVHITDAGLRARMLSRRAELETDPAKRCEFCQRAYAESENDAAYLRPLVESYLAGSQNQPAVKYIEESLRQGAAEAWMYPTLAKAYAALGDSRNSLRALTQDVALRPREGQPRQELGRAFDALGRGTEAVRELRAACEFAFESAQAHRELVAMAKKYHDERAREWVALTMLGGSWLSQDGDVLGEARSELDALSKEFKDAGQLERVKELDAKRKVAEANDITAVMKWDTNGTDIDLHVIEPGDQHVSYNARTSRRGGMLDHDNTSGYGPETYTLKRGVPGHYLIKVHYYSGSVKTNVTVTVTRKQATPEETVQTFNVKLEKHGDEAKIIEFDIAK